MFSSPSFTLVHRKRQHCDYPIDTLEGISLPGDILASGKAPSSVQFPHPIMEQGKIVQTVINPGNPNGIAAAILATKAQLQQYRHIITNLEGAVESPSEDRFSTEPELSEQYQPQPQQQQQPLGDSEQDPLLQCHFRHDSEPHSSGQVRLIAAPIGVAIDHKTLEPFISLLQQYKEQSSDPTRPLPPQQHSDSCSNMAAALETVSFEERSTDPCLSELPWLRVSELLDSLILDSSALPGSPVPLAKIDSPEQSPFKSVILGFPLYVSLLSLSFRTSSVLAAHLYSHKITYFSPGTGNGSIICSLARTNPELTIRPGRLPNAYQSTLQLQSIQNAKRIAKERGSIDLKALEQIREGFVLIDNLSQEQTKLRKGISLFELRECSMLYVSGPNGRLFRPDEQELFCEQCRCIGEELARHCLAELHRLSQSGKEATLTVSFPYISGNAFSMREVPSGEHLLNGWVKGLSCCKDVLAKVQEQASLACYFDPALTGPWDSLCKIQQAHLMCSGNTFDRRLNRVIEQ